MNQSIRPELVGTDLEFIRNSDGFGSVGLEVRKPLITNGEISLESSFSAFESFQELPVGETRSRSIRPTLGIRFSQPLFQYNGVRGRLRDAELSFEAIELSYAEDELALTNRVTGQFYGLFQQQRELEIAAERHRQSQANSQAGSRRYQAGQILEVEYLNLAVRESADEVAFGVHAQPPPGDPVRLQPAGGSPPGDRGVGGGRPELPPRRGGPGQGARAGPEQPVRRAAGRDHPGAGKLVLDEVAARGRARLQLNLGYEVTGNSAVLLDAQNPWKEHLRRAFDAETRAPNTNVSLTLALPLFDAGVNRANVARETSLIREQERRLRRWRRIFVRRSSTK